LPILALMTQHLAEAASVPVVIQLDSGYTLDDCSQA
jgi:fructose-bisphosphate aldolase class II